jgi:uncharacterized protein (DUF2336 family)
MPAMEDLLRTELAAEADPQVEVSLDQRRVNKRGRILREVVDLFLERPQDYTGVQLELFERVMFKLIDQVDLEVRAHLSEQLAPGPYTPSQIARHLASDSEISVAGPMLSLSPRLDDEFLVESAKTKSQQHLRAISERRSIAPRITDVLVDRGDRMVVLTLAGNTGAKFSDKGQSTLLDRACDDAQLAHAVWCRPDIPRQQLLALLDKASAAVRQQLIAEGHTSSGLRAQEIVNVVQEASRRLRSDSQAVSSGYFRARQRVAAAQQQSGLSEQVLLSFIHEQCFEEVVVTLAEMSSLVATDIERMLVEKTHDRLMIVAKALGLSWNAVSELVTLNQPQPMTPEALERLRYRYLSIPQQTATRTLQFHQMRAKAQHGAA